MKKTRKILALGLSFVMMLGLCLTAGTVNAADTTTVSTVDQFNKALDEGKSDITVTEPLTFNQKVDIQGVIIRASDNVSKNFLTFTGGGTLADVNVITAQNTKSAIHIYKCDMTITNLTVDHTLNDGGAPVLVNGEGSKATFTGILDMTLGSKSWYGVNVDKGTADFTSANIMCNTVADTQSVVCLDNSNAQSVTGLPYSTVTTAKHEGKDAQQIAFVQAEDLAKFITAKKDADVTNVVVREKIELTETLNLREGMTISCEGEGAFVADQFTTTDQNQLNVVTVLTNEIVSFNNVKIKTDESTKSGLHIYGGNVTATNLNIDNTSTKGGAAVVLNGGTLELKGTTTFQLGENSWGGINIDNRSNVDPVLNVADGTTIDVTSPEDSVGLYYVDEVKQNEIPLNTAVNLPDNYTFKINGISGTIDKENGELKHIHEATKVPAKEATYDATGNIEYWECTVCGKYFADEALTKEITKADTIIPKLEKPGQPVDPEKEMITITLKAIVDGKEIKLEELGLKPEQYILPVEKGVAFTADDIKVLDDMKESLSVEGYTFRGYFLDAKGTEALKADVPFNADATIYMIWDKEVDVTVTPNPGDTEKPNTDNTNKPEQKPAESDKTVKTDDSSNAALYGLMISLSVVGAGIVVLAKKREELLNK